MNMIYTLAVVIGLMSSTAMAANVVQSFPKQIQYLISEAEIEDGFSGNVLIKKGDFVLFEKSTGFANLEHDVPNKPETKFLIASISKQFTSALILKLEEEGLLSTSDPIGDYLDDDISKKQNLPPYWRQIRIHDLLTHTSGITRDVPQSGNTLRSNRNFLGSLVSALFEYADSFKTNQHLGVDFSYSNSGYVLLAAIAENLCATAFEKCLQNKILNPLNLSNTGIYHRLKILRDQAEGYYRSDGSNQLFRRCCIDATNLVGSHSMYSTALDLSNWMQFLNAEKQSPVLSLASRKKLTMSYVSDLQGLRHQDTGYGYGVFTDSHLGLQRIWHDGNTSGYLSIVSYLPEKDITIVILNNYHGVLMGLNDFYNMRMHDEITQVISGSFR